MKAILLGAGNGTRLYPATQKVPKPFFKIADKPLYQHIIDKLPSEIVDEAFLILNTNYKDWHGDIKTIHLPPDLGTEGHLKLSVDFLAINEPTFVFNSDVMFNFDLGPMVDLYKKYEHKKPIVIAGFQVDYTKDFGVMQVDGDKVVSFLEKVETTNAVINTGIYLMHPDVFALLKDRGNLETQLFKEYDEIYTYVYNNQDNNKWYDTGTPQRYYGAYLEFGKVSNDFIKLGTDGYRGIIGSELSFDVISKIGIGFANFIKQRSLPLTVVIGYDTRLLGKEIALEICRALLTKGIVPIFIPYPITTPNLTYLTSKYFAYGIMVTSSHNPYWYNGVKFRQQGTLFTEQDYKKLEQEINKVEHNSNLEELWVVNPFTEAKVTYLAHIKEKVNIGLIRDAISFVGCYDMNGAGSSYLSEILDTIQISENTLYPEPIASKIPSSVYELAVRYEMPIILFDGDGDRVSFIDEQGHFINPHTIYMILLYHLFYNKNYRGKIVKSYSVSTAVEKMAKRLHLDVITTKIGFKYVAEEIHKQKAFIGGEESGGFAFSFGNLERDGLLTALLVLECMAYENKKLCELVSEIHQQYFPAFYYRFDIDNSLAQQVIGLIDELNYREIEDSIDGIKYLFKDGFILIRKSGTEDVLRIYVDASNYHTHYYLYNNFVKELTYLLNGNIIFS